MAEGLALSIRNAILSEVDLRSMRDIDGIAHSGDVTFGVDVIAERAVSAFFESHRDLSAAYYTEDQGLVMPDGAPELIFIIDPIDGTRPALAGLGTACVSVAVAHYGDDLRLGDIRWASLIELGNGDRFTAVRGKGVSLRSSYGRRIAPSPKSDMEDIFWSFEIVGRPVELVMSYIAPLVDRTSVRAGVFLINSASYSLSRLATGQFDAYLDLGGFVLSECAGARARFLELGGGRVVGLFPYDIAAALLVAKESGCTVTDAYGGDLDDVPLMPSDGEAILSCVAAGNERLHRTILKWLEDMKDERG